MSNDITRLIVLLNTEMKCIQIYSASIIYKIKVQVNFIQAKRLRISDYRQESDKIMEHHRKSEEEWGILDPPAIQQIVVKVANSTVSMNV